MTTRTATATQVPHYGPEVGLTTDGGRCAPRSVA
jgi:hypothetical protein